MNKAQAKQYIQDFLTIKQREQLDKSFGATLSCIHELLLVYLYAELNKIILNYLAWGLATPVRTWHCDMEAMDAFYLLVSSNSVYCGGRDGHKVFLKEWTHQGMFTRRYDFNSVPFCVGLVNDQLFIPRHPFLQESMFSIPNTSIVRTNSLLVLNQLNFQLQLVDVDQQNIVQSWDFPLQLSRQFGVQLNPHGIAVSPSRIFLVDNLKSGIQVFTLKDGQHVRDMCTRQSPQGIVLKENQAFVSVRDGIEKIDLHTGRHLELWEGQKDTHFTALALHQDKLFAYDKGKIRIFHANNPWNRGAIPR